MTEPNSETEFPINGPSAIVEIADVGTFVSSEWGLEGFKLIVIDEVTNLDRVSSVDFSFGGLGARVFNAQVRRGPKTDDSICFYFEGLSNTQYYSLLGMVISATALQNT